MYKGPEAGCWERLKLDWRMADQLGGCGNTLGERRGSPKLRPWRQRKMDRFQLYFQGGIDSPCW